MARHVLLVVWAAGIAVLAGCGGDGAGPAPTGRTVYVDASAAGGGDGSQARPLNDLQAGANLAQAGDTIRLAAGTYDPAGDDPVTVLKPVALVGAGRDATVVKAALVVDARDPNVTVTVSDLDCTGVDFALEPTTPSPMVIRNCRLERVDERGGARAHSLTVEDTVITGGVVFAQGDGAARDTFRRCTIGGEVSLRMGDGATVTLADCVLAGGLGDAGGMGATSLLRCDLQGTAVACSAGAAQPAGGYRFVLEGCQHVGGVACSSTGGVRLQDNAIAGGVRLSCGPPADVIDNTLTGSGGGGGLITSAGAGVITGNTITGFELGVQDSSGATLFADNTIRNCTNGMLARGLAEYRSNTIRDCGEWGLTISAVVSAVSFHHNTITGNGGDGVIVAGRVDLGGGEAGSPGRNVLRGNGGFDLRVTSLAADRATIFAQHNLWDHSTLAQVAAQDVYDAADEATLSAASLAPLGAP